MSEPTLILKNMRGGCATVGGTVHTLFRLTGRAPKKINPLSREAIVAAATEALNELHDLR